MANAVGTTHHVKIGTHYYLVRPFSYSKRAAPLFGARITTGDPDYNNLSIWQHWAQSCWIGGIDADQWVDDAMYDDGVGVDSTVHEQLTLSRDLTIATGGALNANSLQEPRRFFIFRNDNAAANTAKLYALTMPKTQTNSYLWSYTTAGGWVLTKTFTSKKARSFAIFSGKLVVGFENSTFEYAGDPAGSWTAGTLPQDITGSVSCMFVYATQKNADGSGGSKLYVAFANKIYRYASDFTIDGNVVFYEATDADNIADMVNYNGYMHILSRNARLYRSDGNITTPMWGWDANTIGVSMANYDGRLFLATYEYTDTDEVGIGCLYQFTGSAVTQLKRFGAATRATTIGRMMVYDRRLWYGASGLWGMNKNSAGTDLGGFGVASYDAVEDSHCVWATNKDTTTYPDATSVGKDWHVDDVIFWQGIMHVAVRGFGNFKSEISYRDYLRDRAKYDTTTTAATGSANSGFLTSSDYDAGTVGLQKMWRDIVIHCDLAADSVSVGVDYSLDGGKTWTAAGTVSRTLSGTVARTTGQSSLTGTSTKFLNEISVGESIVVGADTRVVAAVTSDTALTITGTWTQTGSGAAIKSASTRFVRRIPLQNIRSNRLKYRLRLNSSSSSYSPVVRGIVVSYLPMPEPNWMWEMVLVCSNKQEYLDGTVNDVDAAADMAYIDALFRSQEMFDFTDLDGSVWAVGGAKGCILYDMTRTTAISPYPAAESGLEGDIRVVILEAVESY